MKTTTPEKKRPPEPPKDLTGLTATAKALMEKGPAKLYSLHNAVRVNMLKNHPDLEFVVLPNQRYLCVQVNVGSYADTICKKPIIMEYLEWRKKLPYFSANFIDKERTVIVSEGPNHHNIADFLLLLYFFDVCVVVSIGRDNGAHGEFDSFVPEQNKTESIGIFIMTTLKQKSPMPLLKISEVEISFNGTRPKQFMHIHIGDWNEFHELNPLVAIVAIQYIQRDALPKIKPQSPILFHCSSGAGRSSCMAMLYMLTNACHSQKEAVDTIPIFTSLVCARKGCMNNPRPLLFMFNTMINYALVMGAIKEADATKWRAEYAEITAPFPWNRKKDKKKIDVSDTQSGKNQSGKNNSNKKI